MVNKKVAVITGAASGIGLALAKACILDGMHVVMADVDELALRERAFELNQLSDSQALGIVCDVIKRSDIERLARETYSQFNRVDWLINNAGVSGPLAPFWDLELDQIQSVLNVNLFGVLQGAHVFLPYLFKQDHPSHIINMASVYGLCSGSHMAPYVMSKQAVVAFSESLYFDLERLNKPVKVSVICPSFVKTQLMAHSTPEKGGALHGMVAGLMQRSRPPEDAANLIVREIKKGLFYILPDKEVKSYCEQRAMAICEQSSPPKHSLENIIASLCKRALRGEE